jgi:extradiol dioxygenase family protein
MDAPKHPQPEHTMIGKLRHFALSVEDPWKTAEFYMNTFGMKKVGEVDTSFVLGVYLSDGVINMAILKYKKD